MEALRREAAAPLRFEPFDGTVTVSFSDAIVASTQRAVLLHEAGHEPVVYVPFDDVYFTFLERQDKTTRCPLKGMASYWRVQAVGEAADDFMWAYETPLDAARPIARHGAFDASIARIEMVPADERSRPLQI